MRETIKYIENILGFAVKQKGLNKKAFQNIPLYIHNFYDIQKIELFEKDVFLLCSKTQEHLTPSQYKKQKILLEQKLNGLIIFVLSDIKSYERTRLIQQKINFIIENKQIFIPELIIDLKEYEIKTPKNRTLQPAAQVIILYHLQKQDLNKFTYKQLASLLDYSYLTISRAVENLVNTDLCKTQGTKEKRLFFIDNKKELWQKSNDLLKSPIKKTIFINDDLPDNIISITNINALAHYTSINKSNKRYFAIKKQDFLKLEKQAVITHKSDYDGDFSIELWSYNPAIISKSSFTDPLSLYLCFRNNKDERIQEALKQLTRSLW